MNTRITEIHANILHRILEIPYPIEPQAITAELSMDLTKFTKYMKHTQNQNDDQPQSLLL